MRRKNIVVNVGTRERKFNRGRSVFLYNAQMKNSLLRYKYYGSREYGKYYVNRCADMWEEI